MDVQLDTTAGVSQVQLNGSCIPNPFGLASNASSMPVPPFSSSSCSVVASYLRKVFLGGLPKYIDEDEINKHFMKFGPLTVVWPHKDGSRTPLNGYAFALFHELSVHWLIKSCFKEEDQYYMFISSTSQSEKRNNGGTVYLVQSGQLSNTVVAEAVDAATEVAASKRTTGGRSRFVFTAAVIIVLAGICLFLEACQLVYQLKSYL